VCSKIKFEPGGIHRDQCTGWRIYSPCGTGAMDFLWYLFSFRGRINRAKCWLAALIIVCWMMFLGIITVAATVSLGHTTPLTINFDLDDIFGIIDPASFRALSSANPAALVLHLLGTPLFLWVYLATSVKRLHDRDRSGWWMALFFVIPGLYGQFQDRLGDSTVVSLLGLSAAGLTLCGGITLYFLRGDKGGNRFGPDPLEPIDTRADWDQLSELQFVPHSAGPAPGAHVNRGP
jgi:uncharacterized membrane protein YhaH (DUF805 family)